MVIVTPDIAARYAWPICKQLWLSQRCPTFPRSAKIAESAYSARRRSSNLTAKLGSQSEQSQWRTTRDRPARRTSDRSLSANRHRLERRQRREAILPPP